MQDSATYYTGSRRLSSEYSSLEAAVDSASRRDVVVVDADYTITDSIEVKSGIKIEGGGGTIRFAEELNEPGLEIRGVEDVWIDTVEIDGNRTEQSVNGDGIGGPANNGEIHNLRITNCAIYDMQLNGISLTPHNSADMSDVYIAGNTIDGVNGHGIVLGVKEGGSGLEDIVIEGNTIRDIQEAQGIGVFGQNGGTARNVAVIGNTVSEQDPMSGGLGMSFEEDTERLIYYGNHASNWERGNLLSITKNGRYNVAANNMIENSAGGGLSIQNFPYFEPEGPPENNILTNNLIRDCRQGIKYWHNNENNVVYHNRIEDSDVVVDTNNGAFPRVDLENGPDVTGNVGLPQTIGNGVVIETQRGGVGVDAAWNRGGPRPDDPVTVRVDAYPYRY